MAFKLGSPVICSLTIFLTGNFLILFRLGIFGVPQTGGGGGGGVVGWVEEWFKESLPVTSLQLNLSKRYFESSIIPSCKH